MRHQNTVYTMEIATSLVKHGPRIFVWNALAQVMSTKQDNTQPNVETSNVVLAALVSPMYQLLELAAEIAYLSLAIMMARNMLYVEMSL